jgi:hypothetical protein
MDVLFDRHIRSSRGRFDVTGAVARPIGEAGH